MMSDVYDVIIIGGGPAAFTAAIYNARGGLKTLMISKVTGGQIGITPVLENYPGILSIKGFEFADILREQVLQWGTEILEAEEALEIKVEGTFRRVITDSDEYRGKAVIIATGTEHRTLMIPGREEFEGHGISYCSTCDGPFYREKIVAVIGGGDTALTDAIYLTGLTKEVHLIHRRDKLRAEEILGSQFLKNPKARMHWDSVVTEIHGDKSVTSIDIKNVKTKEVTNLQIDGLFIAIGADPNNQIAQKSGIALNQDGEIIVNDKQETNIAGIYAAGDITPGERQVATAVGEGCIAAINAQKYLNQYC